MYVNNRFFAVLIEYWKLAKHEQLNISAVSKISKKETMD